MIEVDEHSGEVLDRVMEENNLKSREEAIKLVIEEYESISEPEPRQEYLKKMKNILKEGTYSQGEFEKIVEKGKD